MNLKPAQLKHALSGRHRPMTGTAPIDLVHLARQTGGDTELESELLALFADQCLKHLDTIRRANTKTGSDAAHTLKGAARAIGAWAVADAAERVEEALTRRAVAEGLGELYVAADEARAAIAEMSRAA
jgi:HPt (histidine-containing phosphotransfer) domain-containing protein